MPSQTITITSPENYSNWNYYETKTVDFSGKTSLRKNVTVEKTSETGLGASISTVNYHINGTNSFNGGDGDTVIDYVTIDVNIKTVKQNTYTGTYSNPTSSYIAVQGSITIKVSWEDHIETTTTATNTEPAKTETKTETQLIDEGVISTPPARSQTVSSSVSAVYWTNYPVSPVSETEWVEQRRVLDEGINQKVIDKTHKEKCGFGEIRASQNIVNNLIKDKDTARRIGKAAIFESAKGSECTISIPPNFAIKPRSIISTQIKSRFLNITEQVKRIEIGIAYDHQEYNVTFKYKDEPYLKEGKIILLNTATKQLEEYNFEFVLQKVRTEYTYPASGYIYTDGNYCFYKGSSSLAVDLKTGTATTISLPYEAYAYGSCFDGNFYDWDSSYVKKYSPSGTVSLVFNFGGWTYYNIASNASKLYIAYYSGGSAKVKEFDSTGTIYQSATLETWPDALIHFAVDDSFAYLVNGQNGNVYIYSLEDFTLEDSFTNTDLASENSNDIIHFKVFNSKIFAVRTNSGTTRKLVIDTGTGETEVDKTSGNFTNIQII